MSGPKRSWFFPILLILTTLLILSPYNPNSAQAASLVYHGNVKSKKFHKPGCRYYNCKNCLKKFATKVGATKAGYKPCKVCKP